MKVQINIYNKEKKTFDKDYIEFSWVKLKKSPNFIVEVETNRYLYNKRIKDYYKEHGLPYKTYLYDNFYTEQFDNIFSQINK